MNALREQLPVQPLRARFAASNDDLTVENARLRELRPEHPDQLRKVSGQQFRAAAADLDIRAVEMHDAAKAVPFGFIRQCTDPGGRDRDRISELCEHGLDEGFHSSIMLPTPNKLDNRG